MMPGHPEEGHSSAVRPDSLRLSLGCDPSLHTSTLTLAPVINNQPVGFEIFIYSLYYF